MAVGLTSTQAAILLELQDAHAPIFAETVAKKLGLSSGVIRYNISAINNWLKPRNIKITSRPKVGYKLEIGDREKKLLIDELSQAKIQPVYSALDRRQLLSFDLLCSFEYQSLLKLADKLCLSKATLARELSAVENWLKKRQLYLQKRPRLGTKIVGEEIAIRHTLILLILEAVPETVLMKLIQWGIRDQVSKEVFLHPVQGDILQKLQAWDLQGAMRLVSRVEQNLSLHLDDNRFLYLVLYWAVATFRYQGGQTVSTSREFLDALLNEKEMKILDKTIEDYARESNVRMPKTEILVFLLEVFSSPRSAGRDIQDERGNVVLDDMQASALANRLVEQIAKNTGYQIQNKSVLDRMTVHLSKMLIRLKYKLPIENPFVSEVLRSHPEMWRATQDAITEFGAELGDLSQEEIAYLTMYVVLARQLDRHDNIKQTPRVIVVCPTGGISVWMLVSRLKAEMPDLQIVANVSLREMSRVDRSNADAIITTARNIKDKDLPVIYVSPFLPEDDIAKIQRQFRSMGYHV